MDLTKLIKTAAQGISNNAVSYLAGVSIAATITGTAMGIRAGMQIERKRQQDPQPTAKEDFKNTWKFYVPPAIVCSLGVASTITSFSVSSQRTMALMSAYSLSESSFRDYQEQVQKTLGEKKEQQVRDDVIRQKLEDAPATKDTIIVTEGGSTLCYDSASGRYFKSDMETIRKAVNTINQKLINDMYASQNDFYDEIGLPRTGLGDELGWTSDRLLEVSYSSHLTEENGKPCLAIDYLVGPKRGYYKGY